MAEFRTDTVRIPKSAKLTKEGFLSVKDARIARIGVQTYYKDGKAVRELRLPEDVMASVESFRHVLVTLDHPPELVNADNAAKYQKGFITDCYYGNDGWIHADFHVTDKAAIEAAIVKETHRQLSCGYTCDIDSNGGVWIDELGVMGEKGKEYKYDVKQKSIQGNHTALVERARAGENARFDEDDFDVIIRLDNDIKSKSMTVSTIKTYSDPRKGDKFEIKTDESQAVLPVLDSLQSALNKEYELSSTLQSEKDSIQSKHDSLEGQKVALEAKVKQLEGELESAKSNRFDAIAIKSWLRTYEQVKNVFTADSVDPFTLDELGLKKAYLSSIYPDIKFDEKSAEFVEGVWLTSRNVKPEKQDELKTHLDGLKPTVSRLDSERGDVASRSKNLLKLGGN